MAQHDQNIANADGATVRADINAALAAIFSNSSGSSAPSTTVAYQFWADTTNALLKQRNAANSAWITVGRLDGEGFGLSAQGSNIASASTVDLDAATGNLVDVTGTTAITAITLAQGRWRWVRFTGALTLTHGSNLVLPGGANIITAAGDFALVYGYASSVVRCAAYLKADGTPVVGSAAGSGRIIQSATTSYTSYAGHTTLLPNDDTIPQNTEGTEIMTVSITPTNASNNLRVRFSGNAAGSATLLLCAAVFRDSTADAIHATGAVSAAGNYSVNLTGELVVAAGSTSSTAFKVRVGPNTSGTMYTNGGSSSRHFGGVSSWRLTVEELAA